MSFRAARRHPHPDDVDGDDGEEIVDTNIDPELRLRTVRTCASTIAESIRTEQRAEQAKNKRKFFRARSLGKRKDTGKGSVTTTEPPPPVPAVVAQVEGARRTIYVNTPLPQDELDAEGEPAKIYVRNKVRTTKYTLLTFVPKNLYEQFRRVANLYFLALVVVTVFPVFGAANAQISMLPLVFILVVTAIKDGVEDYRRGVLDEEVNTSPSTKLGQWRNVNLPKDSRSWLEKLFGMNAPGKVTKGVRKLREKEATEGMHVVLNKQGGDDHSLSTLRGRSDSLASTQHFRKLDDIQSVDSHTYSQTTLPASGSALSRDALASEYSLAAETPADARGRSHSVSSMPASTAPGAYAGVMDFGQRVTGTARWERTLWKKLEVGDVVLLRDNEQVPADIVVLATSDADGMCYLETKNLDGETNLKPRKSVRGTAQLASEEDVERSAFVLDSEPPHQNLYLYHGVLRFRNPATGEPKQEAVTINELLLRGCSLRNTDWVIGLVVFTGADTKIMLNGGDTPSKRSKIERETNFNVIMNFVILLLMCTATAIGSGIEDGRKDTSAKFFEVHADATDSPALNALVTFVSCLIAFQNIVPISLYISIEIVKTIQAYFISQDRDMYYQPYDTACVPKTWNISDDLGQIEYVFSDKTGTLTQNIMEFQKCSIHGVVYGLGVSESQRGAALREGRSDMLDPEKQSEQLSKLKEDMLATMGRTFKNRYCQPDKLTLIDPQLADDLAERTGEQRGHLVAFWRAIAVCHTVLADRSDARNPFLTNYKAESPDEAALVAAARDVGFPFVNKSKDSLDIEVLGQPERYTLLKLLEFNSTRKRMSVVVRNPDGRIVLYCKGADSVIYARLAADQDPEVKTQTAKDMEAFANSGLRTLCIAYRYLTEAEYFDWSRAYDEATQATKDRDEEIVKANERIEHSLHILGATALEDKLQEGVPEAIETLHQAGIKLWILTGDKVQTAIEIGFSCNLLKSDMEIMILSADSMDSARSQIEAGLNKMASVFGPPTVQVHGFTPNAKASFAVVIDGDTLHFALDDALKPLFLSLGTQCETVVCCRVSPAQKALAVKLVKEGRNALTLSIGDGANDVAMIQEANIGCGLFGLEGSQAAMSADYAFGQFRFLTKLLIVHGRWSYQRIADMHSNFFYKNVIWTFAMFWFLFWNSFDATYLYQYTFILLDNLVFTSLPVIILGAFDQDINAQAALAFPQLYIRGIRGLEYTRLKFWLYMADGFYQSIIVFFVPYLIWSRGLGVSWNGRGIDSLADFGTTVAVAAICSANFYVGFNTRYWTAITWAVIFGSSILMMLWIIIYSQLDSPDFVDEVTVLFGSIPFWTAVVLSVAICLLPRVLVKFIRTTYFPLDKDIVREMWVKGDLKDRLGIAHKKRRRRDIEAAPIFKNPHLRNESEVDQTAYHPVHIGSPGQGSPGQDSRGLDGTPEQANYTPGERDTFLTPKQASQFPPDYSSPGSSARPSPLPSPYLAPQSPEPTANVFGRGSAGNSSSALDSLLVPGHRPGFREYTGSDGGAYEMRVRSPIPSDGAISPQFMHSATATEFSYATAREPSGDEFAPSPVSGQDHDRPESSLSWAGARAM